MLIERGEVRHDGRVRRAARALHAAGYEVVLLHQGPQHEEHALSGDGGHRRSVLPVGRLRRALEVLPRPVRRIATWLSYARNAAQLRPDVVHAHDLPMLAPAWIAAKLTGALLVYDTHELATETFHLTTAGRRVVQALERALIGRCSAVITVSPAIATELERRYALDESPAVVRNVPELDWGAAPDTRAGVRDLREQLGIGSASLVLHQGAANPGRGCEEIVRSLRHLPGVHLLFLGEVTPQYWHLLAAEAGPDAAGRRLHQLPNVPVETLLAHTRQADVAVTLFDPRQPNYRRTYSNKVFEYIAAGVPIVAASGTAVGELVEELGVGATVPFGDAVALADAIDRLLLERGDPARRDRLSQAADELNWSREQHALLRTYASLDLATASRCVRNGGTRANRA